MKNLFYTLSISFLTLFHNLIAKIDEKKFVVIIPSYKNEQWVEKNLTSIFNQKYSNFRIIYIDDLSPDRTLELVKNFKPKKNQSIHFSLIENQIRKGALQNLYEAIHSCDDDEIIVTVDGDDWLAHSHVLSHLNKVYSQLSPIWLTHGTYRTSKGDRGFNRPAPQEVIERNSFRKDFQSSHLRTFYAWLFKKIRKEDLLYKGEFFSMAWDSAMLFPMLEMAGSKHAYIPDVMYIYNVSNPISDYRKDERLQLYLDKLIRNKPRYRPLQTPKDSASYVEE